MGIHVVHRQIFDFDYGCFATNVELTPVCIRGYINQKRGIFSAFGHNDQEIKTVK